MSLDLWEIEDKFPDERAPAEQLVALMSELSEDCYCAGWLHDCEHTLWGMIAHGDDLRWGIGAVIPGALATLKRLAGEIGGWPVWDRGSGIRVAPMAEWLPMHAAWRRDVLAPAPEGEEGTP